MWRLLIPLSCLLLQPCFALTLYTEVNEPFNYIEPTHGKAVGISVDLISEAARRANVPITIQFNLPWARALALVAHPDQRDACILSPTRTAEREPYYQWVGPLARAKWALFARADFKRQLSTLDDARPYKIGGYIQDSRTSFVEELGGFKLDIAADDKLNPRKLMAGRIDLWISNLYGGRKMAESLGVHGVKPVLVFHEMDNYMACGRWVPAETIDSLQQALDKMRSDGSAKRITDSYLKNY
jgi:polar amino acid transport system substrate-binding protein